jgi:AraC-like DNA-binding protein
MACVLLIGGRAGTGQETDLMFIGSLPLATPAEWGGVPLARPGSQSEWNPSSLTLLLPGTELNPGRDADQPGLRRVGTAGGPGALLARYLWSLAEQAGHMPRERLESLALATRALVGACCGPSEACPAGETQCASSTMIERARLGVRRNMASPEFGPAELARLLAMSRSKLYRLLLAEGGVAHFINRERLLQAKGALATDEGGSIHAIATRVGFKDHSTFSRAFRREFGTTPTQMRMGTPPMPVEASRMRVPQPGFSGPGPAEAMLAGAWRENGMTGPDLGF